MPSRQELILRGNAVGLTDSTYPNDSKFEQKILYLEKNATTFAGTLATGTLTSDATNVADGDTVTIGTRVYTFKTALGTTAGQVLIGADAATSLDNLKSAINNTGTAGTDYTANTPIHARVTATTNTDTTQVVQAREYSDTNADIATTETSAHLSWGATTLASGVAKHTARQAAVVAGISGDANVL